MCSRERSRPFCDVGGNVVANGSGVVADDETWRLSDTGSLGHGGLRMAMAEEEEQGGIDQTPA